MIKKIAKYIVLSVGGLVGLVAIYFIAAYLLTIIPCNSSFKEPSEGIVIFVKSNGVHTDIVVPVKNKLYNWTQVIDTTDFKSEIKTFEYISIGWGDKGFYLYTPTWADLKFSTAFNAAFLPSPTAMHITYLPYTPKTNDLTRKIIISEQQYQIITSFINESFKKDATGNVQLINCCHYDGVNDNFYEAEGSYHLFKTCNSWTNIALRKAGIKTATWAPFDKCILYHFE